MDIESLRLSIVGCSSTRTAVTGAHVADLVGGQKLRFGFNIRTRQSDRKVPGTW